MQYEVFGDSIVAGLGLPPHLTWVAGLSHHLAVTEPAGAEHRFTNRGVDGQSIVTTSRLAVDPLSATLLADVARFVADPPGDLPIAQRRYVVTPSVNELIVSDQGRSSNARVATAADGVRRAVDLLLRAGAAPDHIVVLPMPPIGTEFGQRHDAGADVDAPLNTMIAATNRALAGTLTLARYARLDPDGDGYAAAAFFDDWQPPPGSGGGGTAGAADGLHFDAEGHALIASEIEWLFGTR